MVQGCVDLLYSDSHVLANYAKTPLSFLFYRYGCPSRRRFLAAPTYASAGIT